MLYSVLLFFFLILFSYYLNKEKFGLPNAHNYYVNYRNYIDDNYRPHTIAYKGFSKISDACFVDKYAKCSGNKNMCQQQSLLSCLGPSMISGKF